MCAGIGEGEQMTEHDKIAWGAFIAGVFMGILFGVILMFIILDIGHCPIPRIQCGCVPEIEKPCNQ